MYNLSLDPFACFTLSEEGWGIKPAGVQTSVFREASGTLKASPRLMSLTTVKPCGTNLIKASVVSTRACPSWRMTD